MTTVDRKVRAVARPVRPLSPAMQKAVDQLNHHDDGTVMRALEREAVAGRHNATQSALAPASTEKHHQMVAALTIRNLSSPRLQMTSLPARSPIATNGPNTPPTAHLIRIAVGLEVAA